MPVYTIYINTTNILGPNATPDMLNTVDQTTKDLFIKHNLNGQLYSIVIPTLLINVGYLKELIAKYILNQYPSIKKIKVNINGGVFLNKDTVSLAAYKFNKW
eukprot:UN00957